VLKKIVCKMIGATTAHGLIDFTTFYSYIIWVLNTNASISFYYSRGFTNDLWALKSVKQL